VLVTAPLAALSPELAPEGWLVFARAGAIVATALAFVLAQRLAGGSPAAGLAAALGLCLVPGWIEGAATGMGEGVLVALVLLAISCAFEGRMRAAFALGVGAALLRVEVWPFLLALAVIWVRRDRSAVRPVTLATIAVAALWFVPELVGSGELLRSADRARVPNPGAPALARSPALATLATAVRLPPALVLAGLAALVGVSVVRRSGRRRGRGALLVAALGAAWVALVAAMSELGFSGEARYLLPGVALLAVGGSAGLFVLLESTGRRAPLVGRGRGVAVTAVAIALAVTAVARAGDFLDGIDRVAYGAALVADLERAVARAGGAPSLARCGTPVVGPYRGPMLAWALGVHKAEVDFEPVRPGVVFRSRLGRNSAVAPGGPPGGPDLATETALWRVEAACGPRRLATEGVERDPPDAPEPEVRLP
jgi:hypothetical protein